MAVFAITGMKWRRTMAWLAGIYGMVLGSFFTLVGLRMPRGQSIVMPPSRCDACQRRLSWYELIPVVSWMGLRGRCRTCGARVPWMYPFVEFLTGLAFFLAAEEWHLSIAFWIAAWSAAGFAVIAVTDAEAYRIPDAVLIPLAAGLILLRIFGHLPLWSNLWGGLAGIALLWAIRAASRGGMGLGDVKLFGYVGLLVGVWGMLLTLMLAAIGGLLYGGVLLIAGRLRADHRLPFGPAITVAAMAVYLYGSGFLSRYWAIR